MSIILLLGHLLLIACLLGSSFLQHSLLLLLLNYLSLKLNLHLVTFLILLLLQLCLILLVLLQYRHNLSFLLNSSATWIIPLALSWLLERLHSCNVLRRLRLLLAIIFWLSSFWVLVILSSSGTFFICFRIILLLLRICISLRYMSAFSLDLRCF